VQDPKRTIFKGKGFALGKDAEAESEFSLGLNPPKKRGQRICARQGCQAESEFGLGLHPFEFRLNPKP
jgi:hypothetical protein